MLSGMPDQLHEFLLSTIIGSYTTLLVELAQIIDIIYVITYAILLGKVWDVRLSMYRANIVYVPGRQPWLGAAAIKRLSPLKLI